jgi:hypothetical protein
VFVNVSQKVYEPVWIFYRRAVFEDRLPWRLAVLM